MYRFVKRILDFIFALLLLVITSPILFIACLAILIKMGYPILFTQMRIGQNNEPFKVLKLRTMLPAGQKKKSDAQRLTKLGSILRKTSIDELPQLINIIKGEMSFIGPRPLLPDYLPYYSEREIRRHEVKPGMSCLAQVKGRSYVTWDEQFELDVIYVENFSLKTDVSILLKTIPKVLSSSDMMVTGRIDKDRFDVHRQKQLTGKKS